MVTAAILPLSMGIAFFANANIDIETQPPTFRADHNQPVPIECTEVVLEFRVGGIDRNTKSKDCPQKP